MRLAAGLVRAAATVSALACAQCHDWDQFNRPPVADGSTVGDYRCGVPYALVGVWSANAAPEVQRVRLTDSTPCTPLPLPSFRRGDPVRAIATLGSRVLVASEAGACILDVSDTALSETCTQVATNAVVIDAFVRIDPQPRFAISLAIGTSGAISHLLLEDAEHKFTEQRPLSSAGLSSLGGAPIRSIMNSPEDPFRLFAAREDREELVSALQDNTDRRVHLTAFNGSPISYGSLGVGPSNSNGSVVALLPRNEPAQFAMLLNATRFPSSSCSGCTRLAHVIPNSIDPRQQIVACDDAGGRPALLLHGTDTSCGTIAAFAAGAHVSRIAIRWPE